jgi:hypothetical protein
MGYIAIYYFIAILLATLLENEICQIQRSSRIQMSLFVLAECEMVVSLAARGVCLLSRSIS